MIGATAGQAYEVSGWEIFLPLYPLYNSGDWNAYIERAKPLTDRHHLEHLLFFLFQGVNQVVTDNRVAPVRERPIGKFGGQRAGIVIRPDAGADPRFLP